MKCQRNGCSNEADEGYRSCSSCRKRDYAASSRYRTNNPKQPGQCNRKDCPNQADSGFKSCASCRKKTKDYEDSVRPLLRERHNKYYLQVKGEVFSHYGGPRCACCGETHIEFLSVDHVGNTGAAHRLDLNGDARNGVNIYYWLKKNGFPPGFQILCMNCNFSLGHHGYCPHHPEITRPVNCGLKAQGQIVRPQEAQKNLPNQAVEPVQSCERTSVKILVCKNCDGHEEVSTANFVWRNLEFVLTCRSCGHTAVARVREPVVGTMKLTPQLRADILLGKKSVLATVPQSVIEEMGS